MSEQTLAEASIDISPKLDMSTFEAAARTIGKRLEKVTHGVWHKMKESFKEDLKDIGKNFISGGLLATVSEMIQKVGEQFDEVTQKTTQYFQLFQTLQDTASQFGTTVKGMQLSYAVAGSKGISKEDFNAMLTLWQQRLYTLSPKEYARYSKMSAPQGLFQWIMDMQASGFSKETINKNLGYMFGNRRVVRMVGLANADIASLLKQENASGLYDNLDKDATSMGDAYGKLMLIQSHAETKALKDMTDNLQGGKLKTFLEAQEQHLEDLNDKYQDQIKHMQGIADADKALAFAMNKLEEAIDNLAEMVDNAYKWLKPRVKPGAAAVGNTISNIAQAAIHPQDFRDRYSSKNRTPSK